MSSVTTTPVEVLFKGTSYSWTSYDKDFGVYTSSESFMFGYLNEFPEASRTHYPVQCGLYTDDHSTQTVHSNYKDHSCNIKNCTVLGETTWSHSKKLDLCPEYPIMDQEYPEEYVPVNDEGITEAPTLCENEDLVEVSASNNGVCSLVEEDVMNAIIQYEYEDYVEVSLIQAEPQ